MTGRATTVFLSLVAGLALAACSGDSGEEGDANACVPTASCRASEVQSTPPCPDCRSVDDGCGGTIYCAPDASCDNPCDVGEYEVFGGCPDESCVTRMACGEEVVCHGQSACLADARCTDGSYPLEVCPEGSTGCLPTPLCGVTRYCQAVAPCAQSACDPGEAPTVLPCSDPSISFPCREIEACGGAEQVSCVCAAQELECDPDETFDTEPCTPGQECREVMGCGQVFYCKGDSI